jgi:hypothetical protein
MFRLMALWQPVAENRRLLVGYRQASVGKITRVAGQADLHAQAHKVQEMNYIVSSRID